VKQKSQFLLSLVLMLLFALTRIPGIMPQNFSAAYALAFCAGVYFSGIWRWWLPLGTLLITDILLNVYYAQKMGTDVYNPRLLWFMLGNYLAFALIIRLGQAFGPRMKFSGLLGGGLLSALLFYLVTNTASWLFNPFRNPEYTFSISGWLVALTKGTAGWPETWQFFRNTLMSGGLFTGIFVAAVKIEEHLEKSPEPEQTPAESSPAEKAEA